jgi:hypothetical protein
MTANDLITQALAQKATDPRRAFKIEWQDGVYWLKQATATPKKQKIWHRAQGIVAAILGMPILRPTSCAGNAADLKAEQSHMEEWRRLDLPVPRIILSGDGWFVTKDAGIYLTKVLHAFPPKEQTAILNRALDILLRAHKAGVCHGRPMTKDIMIDTEGRLTFLDFEEDPAEVMPLSAAQGRDLLVFLSSASDSPALPALIQKALENCSVETREHLAAVVEWGRPLRLLAKWLKAGKRNMRINKMLNFYDVFSQEIKAAKSSSFML